MISLPPSTAILISISYDLEIKHDSQLGIKAFSPLTEVVPATSGRVTRTRFEMKEGSFDEESSNPEGADVDGVDGLRSLTLVLYTPWFLFS